MSVPLEVFIFGERLENSSQVLASRPVTGQPALRSPHGGERRGARAGDADREGRVGEVRPGDQQPGDGRLHQRRPPIARGGTGVSSRVRHGLEHVQK